MTTPAADRALARFKDWLARALFRGEHVRGVARVDAHRNRNLPRAPLSELPTAAAAAYTRVGRKPSCGSAGETTSRISDEAMASFHRAAKHIDYIEIPPER